MKPLTNTQRWIAIMTFGMANGVIYLLPYIQYPYYDSMVEAFKFNNTQMGTLISVFGIINAVLYPIGGLVLDKYAKDKVFIILAMILTGLGGLWFACYPGYYESLAIMSLWGFTTTFLFWTAFINGKRRLGTGADMGKVFGLSESFSMVIGMLASASGLYIFNAMGNDFSKVIIYYSILHFVGAFFCFIFIPSDKRLLEQETDKGTISREKVDVMEGLKYLIRRPDIWYISVIIFCSYGIGMTIGRISPYLTAVFGVSVTLAAAIGIVNQYVVSIAGPSAGGLIADKLRSSSTFIKYCFVWLAAAAIMLIVLPGNAKLLAVAVLVGWSVKLIQTCQRGAYWVPLTDTRLPESYSGTAIGLVSFLGFLPEAFIQTLWGAVLDHYADDKIMGYKIIFAGILTMAVVGFIFCQLLLADMRKRGLLDEKGKTIIA